MRIIHPAHVLVPLLTTGVFGAPTVKVRVIDTRVLHLLVILRTLSRTLERLWGRETAEHMALPLVPFNANPAIPGTFNVSFDHLAQLSRDEGLSTDYDWCIVFDYIHVEPTGRIRPYNHHGNTNGKCLLMLRVRTMPCSEKLRFDVNFVTLQDNTPKYCSGWHGPAWFVEVDEGIRYLTVTFRYHGMHPFAHRFRNWHTRNFDGSDKYYWDMKKSEHGIGGHTIWLQQGRYRRYNRVSDVLEEEPDAL